MGGGGSGGGGGDRPLRAQLVVALVVGLVLLAVPLYLWRRPSGTENAPTDGGNGDAASGPSAAPTIQRLPVPDAGALVDELVRLDTPQRVKCAASSRSRGQEGTLCDRLEVFEKALSKAIRENVDCAPKTGKEGNLNYVLSVDFNAKRLHVFPGASGMWKGPQARKAAACVTKSLPKPEWDKIKHQYRFYMIAISATYPAPTSTGNPSQLFE